jgi:hypothetical protein
VEIPVQHGVFFRSRLAVGLQGGMTGLRDQRMFAGDSRTLQIAFDLQEAPAAGGEFLIDPGRPAFLLLDIRAGDGRKD